MTITTDNTDYIPFVTYAKSGKAREALWRLYRLRGHPKNLEVLSRMLEKRHELAHAARLRELGRLRDGRQDDRLAEGGDRLHRAHRAGVGARAPSATTRSCSRASARTTPARDAGGRRGTRRSTRSA